MDTLSRRLAYARQRYGDTPETAQRVMDAIRAGTEDALLLPGQRSRVRHKRGGQGAHRQAQRTRQQEQAARMAEARSVLYEGSTDAPAGIPRDAAPGRLRMQVEGLRMRARKGAS